MLNALLKALRTTSPFAVALLAGCASMLPSGSNNTPLPFESFEAAQLALEKVVPFKTTVDELTALGFDAKVSANVTLIPYPDVVGRLAPHPAIPLSALDPGVRECISAQTACRAYVFHFVQDHRERTGNFWLDFLNIRRTTTVTGWQFNGLVVVKDGVVLFRNFAGIPKVDRTEKQSNPLGPFQPAGESAGRSLLR